MMAAHSTRAELIVTGTPMAAPMRAPVSTFIVYPRPTVMMTPVAVTGASFVARKIICVARRRWRAKDEDRHNRNRRLAHF